MSKFSKRVRKAGLSILAFIVFEWGTVLAILAGTIFALMASHK